MAHVANELDKQFMQAGLSAANPGPDGLLFDEPIQKPAQWTRHANSVATEVQLMALRHSLACGTPFSDTRRPSKTAAKLGPESSLRARDRPTRLEK
jgi:hypothetical protein